MRLMVSSYNNGAVDWNAEAEETELLSYKITHMFNEPAECTITLADPSGTLMQKYNDDDNDVYLGVGKVTLEDPTATDIFYGRIIKAVGNSDDKTLTLVCRDWLDQLDEEHITYDMREKLSGNIRQSVIKSDYDDTDGYGIAPANRFIYKAFLDDGGAFTDYTTEANEDTADDVALLPAVPAVNDAFYFGFLTAVDSFVVDLSTAGIWAGTCEWEYWDGGAWSSLSTQPTGSFSTFEWALGTHEFDTCSESDWATTAVNGTTCYWIRARVSAYTGVTTQPLGASVYGEYAVYDHDIGLTADAHNGMKMFLTAGMAGTNSWQTGPYQETVTPSAAPMNIDLFIGGGADDISYLWSFDDEYHSMSDSADFYVVYDFKSWIPDSDFYVANSITGARVKMKFRTGATFVVTLQVNSGGYTTITEMDQVSGGADEYKVFEIPTDLLAGMFDANGEANIKVDVANPAGGTIRIYYMMLEIDTITTGYATGIDITDGETYRLTVGTDLSADATKVWDICPYCVAQPIYKHIDSAETPGDLIDISGDATGDPIVPLTCAATIEHTTGYSTRQYKENTRLKILQSLAQEDLASFWITLGTATVTWKKTFGADTMQLTDGKVESWQSLQDYNTMVNEYHIYGANLGDAEVYQNVENAASQTKFLATRSKVIKGAGIVSNAHAKEIGTALAARQNNVPQMVACTIPGNTATVAHATTIKLGEIVEITSSYLWPAAAKDYIVSRWAYDSAENKTYLTMYPKVSTGAPEIDTIHTRESNRERTIDSIERDKYVPTPVTNEVS